MTTPDNWPDQFIVSRVAYERLVRVEAEARAQEQARADTLRWSRAMLKCGHGDDEPCPEIDALSDASERYGTASAALRDALGSER